VLCNVTLLGQHTLTNGRKEGKIQDISGTRCGVSLGRVRVLQLIPRNRPSRPAAGISATGQEPLFAPQKRLGFKARHAAPSAIGSAQSSMRDDRCDGGSSSRLGDRRAVARYAGLTGSPDESGSRQREGTRMDSAASSSWPCPFLFGRRRKAEDRLLPQTASSGARCRRRYATRRRRDCRHQAHRGRYGSIILKRKQWRRGP
jgi:hypothetical protein